MTKPKKPIPKVVAKILPSISLMKIENNVPLVGRRPYDPVFEASVLKILNDIRPRQSFVVERPRLHMIKRIINDQFEAYKMKTAIVDAEKKFVRIWRLV